MEHQQQQVNKNLRTDIIEIEVLNIGVGEFVIGSAGQLNVTAAKKIISIEAFSVAQVPLAPSGKTVINAAVFAKSFIKLIDSANVEYRTLPLYSISKQVNGTVIPVLNAPPIDTQKSKIVVANTAALVLNEVFLLAIHYEK